MNLLRSVVFILFFSVYFIPLNAQQPGLNIENTPVCSSQQSVLIPLMGTNLVDIGAISLFLTYDAQSLSFDTIENIDLQLPELLFNNQVNPARIAIVWSSTAGANFPDKKLLDMKFNLLKDTGALAFNSGCEIANINLQILPVTYSGGSIFHGWPQISKQPENKTVKVHQDVIFSVTSPDATVFHWLESRTNGTSWLDLEEGSTYNGVQTSQLTIRNVPAGYNQYRYRCRVDKDSCPVYSTIASLSVDSASGLNEWGNSNPLQLFISPNPFTEYSTINYYVPDHGNVTIEIFSLTGKSLGILVNSNYTKGSYIQENCLVSLQAGMYFCQYIFINPSMTFRTYCRLIKIS